MSLLNGLRRQYTIASVSGIPVRADVRWFLIAFVLTAITAASINPLVSNWTVSLVLGAATMLLFFGSIFLHEFAHAVVARFEKLQVVEIVLHPFGGLTRFSHEPKTPRAEFRVAVAGPAGSFILAILFALLMTAANSAGLDILAAIFFLLTLANFLLAVFNLFPGYPLDGGRVLRAYLWKNGRDLDEATRLTGRSGQIIAVGLVFLGLYFVVERGQLFTGLWAILTGVFLFDSANGILRELNKRQSKLAADVMKLAVPIDPESSVQDFFDRVLPMYRQRAFPVAARGQLYGILLLEDLKRVESSFDWRKTQVHEVMRPVSADFFVETDTSMADANELMRVNGIASLGVIDKSGLLVGFLSK